MNKKGFTIVEIIVCLTIIFLIATITVVSLNKNEPQNKQEKYILSSADVYMNNNIIDKNVLEQNHVMYLNISELINAGLLDENEYNNYRTKCVKVSENDLGLTYDIKSCKTLSYVKVNNFERRSCYDSLPILEVEPILNGNNLEELKIIVDETPTDLVEISDNKYKYEIQPGDKNLKIHLKYKTEDNESITSTWSDNNEYKLLKDINLDIDGDSLIVDDSFKIQTSNDNITYIDSNISNLNNDSRNEYYVKILDEECGQEKKYRISQSIELGVNKTFYIYSNSKANNYNKVKYVFPNGVILYTYRLDMSGDYRYKIGLYDPATNQVLEEWSYSDGDYLRGSLKVKKVSDEVFDIYTKIDTGTDKSAIIQYKIIEYNIQTGEISDLHDLTGRISGGSHTSSEGNYCTYSLKFIDALENTEESSNIRADRDCITPGSWEGAAACFGSDIEWRCSEFYERYSDYKDLKDEYDNFESYDTIEYNNRDAELSDYFSERFKYNNSIADGWVYMPSVKDNSKLLTDLVWENNGKKIMGFFYRVSGKGTRESLAFCTYEKSIDVDELE